MRIAIEVSEEQLKDLVITAIEGGITSGWAHRIDAYSPSKGTAIVDDGEKRRTVSVHSMARGLKLCAAAKLDEGGWAFGAWARDRIGDAIIADVILQFGVFGEVIYG